MPLNLLKSYNAHLDISGMSAHVRENSLKAVFDRDITNNARFLFRGKQITPTPKDGEIKMSLLFRHLTTKVIDEKTREREFDLHRSKRLHWLKFHIEERCTSEVLIFSIKEPNGFRTYLFDVTEKYVIILEPLRDGTGYYLLTAYHVMGRDVKRKKFENKYKKRKLPELL